MSLITDIFEVCERVDDPRDEYKVLGHTMAELGELAEEITIYKGDSYKGVGSDGVLGEAIDTILCLVDLIYVHCKSQGIELTEQVLQDIASRKLNKWEYKVTENIKKKEQLVEWNAPAGFTRGSPPMEYSGLVQDTPNSGCDFHGSAFGATYPDAICIDGYLWDLDSCDEPGGPLHSGGDIPCPKCNTQAYNEYFNVQGDVDE